MGSPTKIKPLSIRYVWTLTYVPIGRVHAGSDTEEKGRTQVPFDGGGVGLVSAQHSRPSKTLHWSPSHPLNPSLAPFPALVTSHLTTSRLVPPVGPEVGDPSRPSDRPGEPQTSARPKIQRPEVAGTGSRRGLLSPRTRKHPTDRHSPGKIFLW